MKITATKVKRELHKNYGWDNMDTDANKFMVNELIKDTISVVDDILKIHKNITIKK